MLTISDILTQHQAGSLPRQETRDLLEAQVTVDSLMRTMKRCGETTFAIKLPALQTDITRADLVTVGDSIDSILNTRFGVDQMTPIVK